MFLLQLLMVIRLSVIVTAIRLPFFGVLYYIGKSKVVSSKVTAADATRHIIWICIDILAVGIDAFSILDDILASPHLFLKNIHLTNSVITFIAITTCFNNSVLIGEDSNSTGGRTLKYIKHVFTLFANFPFLVIRSYIIVLTDELDLNVSSSKRKLLYVLFIGKEALITTFTAVLFLTDITTDCKSSEAPNRAHLQRIRSSAYPN